MNFSQFASVVWPAVAGGVGFHHLLAYFRGKFAAKVNEVATAVETGNVAQLRHDAAGVIDFVQTHDPALAKAVEEKFAAAKAAAEAEVERARQGAAEELRKVADLLQHVGAPAPVQAVPTALPGVPVTPPVS